MKLWDSLRTAFQLAERVEECESKVQSLEYEWGDINEKLLAREARLNKRLSRELKAQLSESPTSSSPSTPVLELSDEKSSTKRDIVRNFVQQRAER